MGAETISPPEIETPPVSPIEEEGDGDGELRPQVILYGDDRELLENSSDSARHLNETIWANHFDIRHFTELEDLDTFLQGRVCRDPKVLVALVYFTTQRNVDRCLESCLGFLERVPGFDSTKRMEESIGDLVDKVPPEFIPKNEDPGEYFRSIHLNAEPRARMVRTIVTVRPPEAPLKLTGNMDLIFDRWPDIGGDLKNMFVGEGPSAFPSDDLGYISQFLVKEMTDYTMFGDSDWL